MIFVKVRSGWLLILVLALAAAFVAGCGDDNGDKKDSKKDAAATQGDKIDKAKRDALDKAQA